MARNVLVGGDPGDIVDPWGSVTFGGYRRDSGLSREDFLMPRGLEPDRNLLDWTRAGFRGECRRTRDGPHAGVCECSDRWGREAFGHVVEEARSVAPPRAHPGHGA